MAVHSSPTTNSFVPKLVTLVILGVAFFISAGTVIYLSLRGKEVTVPDLIGKAEGEAENLLEDQGLRLKVRNRTTDEKIQANLVSEQLPNAGTVVKAGQVVNVTISTGIEARKEDEKAVAKATPTATPKPKPKPSASPNDGTEGDSKPKVAESGTQKTVPGKSQGGEKNAVSKGKDLDKGEGSKAKATPNTTPKASPKPTVKPSPKKTDKN